MKRKRNLKKIQFEFVKFFKNWKKILLTIIILSLSFLFATWALNLWIGKSYSSKTYDFDEFQSIPHKKVAIVFGAGLYNGKPNSYLEDRVIVAVNLYKQGIVEKIIMSGKTDGDYNEPDAMIALALEQGIPEAALQADYGGRKTYDTCIRAKKVFDIDESILITQSFHMTRALYTCNAVGIDVIGVNADLRDYPNMENYKFRDYMALLKAIWETKVSAPNSVKLKDTIEL